MAETLPDPLVPAEVDLRGYEYMPLDVVRLMRSASWRKARSQPELGYWMVNLWVSSWHEVPAASLPEDDDELADFARCEPRTWAKVKAKVLAGWIKCSDGRLYHPVVAEKAVRAWTRHHRLRHATLRKFRQKRITGPRWAKVRNRIFARDGYACRACGTTSTPFEIDHVKPLAAGGTHHDDNLQVLCAPCNRRKSFKMAA